MKKREKQLISELLKNSKLSDRDIAKKLEISQPTVTRIRKILEKKFIKSYTIVPDLAKLNIKLIAVTFATCPKPTQQLFKRIEKFVNEHPNIVFAGHGEGLGKTKVFISFHNEFSDFTEFLRKIRLECEDFGSTAESFIVSTDKLIQTLNMSKAVEYLINKRQAEA